MSATTQQTEAGSAAGPALASNAQAGSKCPPHVLEAIYGKPKNKEEKEKEYEASLKNWWTTYAERRHDEEEYVADT